MQSYTFFSEPPIDEASFFPFFVKYVIDEVCQRVGRFGSHHSDAANNAASVLRLDANPQMLNRIQTE